jgi:hypothetical protein
MVVKVNLARDTRTYARELSGNILKIRRRNDMATVEDIKGLVPRHLPGYAFRHANVAHILDGGS